MNILYHHRTQGKGAEGVHIRSMVMAFRDLGHTVTVVSPPGVDPLREGAAVSRPSVLSQFWGFLSNKAPQILFEIMELGYNFWAGRRMLALASGGSFDFIYERHAVNTFAGLLVARRCQLPLLLEVNDAASVERVRKISMKRVPAFIERKMFAGACAIATVSSTFKDAIVAQGVAAEKIFVLPNAIDGRMFSIRRAHPDQVRKRYALEGKLVIGYVGGFAPWHRLDMLLAAFRALRVRHAAAALLLVGDGVTFGSARAYANDRGLGGVVAMPGRVPHAEIPEHISAMDICVIPDCNDFCSPMKLFEYMAMGKPAVAPRLPSLREIVADGVDGILFEPRNQAALAAALDALLADRALRNRLGRAARTTVLSRYSWRGNAEKALAAVRDCR
jgi:glycosyltransferase involved in cell wall biosynthesis